MSADRNKFYLGKVDYNGNGRRNCKAFITWTLQGGNFAMQAEVWNPRETDLYCGGQCVDYVAEKFPENDVAQRMLAVWEEWHLNDLTPGSPAQMAHLASLSPQWTNATDEHKSFYSWACSKLEEAGLHPDPNYLHNGEPYRYGSAWLKRKLPPAIVAEINSWPTSTGG